MSKSVGSIYPGWVPATAEEVQAACEQASIILPHRRENILRAIQSACISFQMKNPGFYPKHKVIQSLALKVLPAFEKALVEWEASAPPIPADRLGIALWNAEREAFVMKPMYEVCESEDLVPASRWWIRDMLAEFQSNRQPIQ